MGLKDPGPGAQGLKADGPQGPGEPPPGPLDTKNIISFNIVGGFLNLTISDKYYLDFIESIKDDNDESINRLNLV